MHTEGISNTMSAAHQSESEMFPQNAQSSTTQNLLISIIGGIAFLLNALWAGFRLPLNVLETNNMTSDLTPPEVAMSPELN